MAPPTGPAPEIIARIVADPRLTPEAARVVLYVAFKGEGEQNVKGVELSILVGGGERPIRAAIARAEFCGWLRSAFGGRAGHKLTFCVPEEMPAPVQAFQNEMTAPAQSFSGNAAASAVISDTVVGSRKDVGIDPPVVPPAVEMLDERTEGAIARFGSKLTGCRGALRDYLRAAVPTPARRYAYVNTVATWLDGGDPSVWKLPDGSSLPPPDRPLTLAAALNEMAAGDEKLMKRPVGDPGNLKTKINVLLKQRSDHAGGNGNSTGTNGGRAARTSRAAAPITPPGQNLNRRRGWDDDDPGELDHAG